MVRQEMQLESAIHTIEAPQYECQFVADLDTEFLGRAIFSEIESQD